MIAIVKMVVWGASVLHEDPGVTAKFQQSETSYQKLEEEGDGLMDNVLAIQHQGLQ